MLRALPTNTEHNEFINGGFVDVSPCMVWYGMVPQSLSSSIIQNLIYNNHSGRRGRKEGMN